MTFLPTTLAELNCNQPDFIVVTPDAYVDHPSFGAAIIGRLVQSEGFSVAVLSQPVTREDFKSLGEPKYGFLLSCGVVDSMVANYSVGGIRRKDDAYSDQGKAGKRPDRVCEVYAKALKKAYPDCFIVAGGIEPSLRRLAHYDYWSDSVRPSILASAPVDLIVYGMGEVAILEILHFAKMGANLKKIRGVAGTAYLTDIANATSTVKKAIESNGNKKYKVISSFTRVASDKKIFAKAFMDNANCEKHLGVIQKQSDTTYAVINPPASPAPTVLLDRVYTLPFVRSFHPKYKNIPAIEEVKFSVTAHRGCYGDCSFCALKAHQGKGIASRSLGSIIAEVEAITTMPDFKGYIHDIGGPSANFHTNPCAKSTKGDFCQDKQCIGHNPCKAKDSSHEQYLKILRAARAVKGVKKIFVRSGIRFDHALLNKEFLTELITYHISGQLKVAPEHVSDNVLALMNKPNHKTYLEFYNKFMAITKSVGKEQYLVPYFVSSHPGCTLKDAAKLTEYLMDIKYMPLQVQDFYPTPMSLSTTMYYCEFDPRNGKKLFVAKTKQDKLMQRALMQYRLEKNRSIVREALKLAKRDDLLARL